jgi:hypothetical protein
MRVPWLLEQYVQDVGCIRVSMGPGNLMRFLTEVIIFETLLLSMRYIRFLLTNFICGFVTYNFVLITGSFYV